MTISQLRLAKDRMKEVIEKFSGELAGIHTGRASTTLVEKIEVESYGQRLPLKAIATINVPEPTQIAIVPWDKGQLVQIEAAIRESDLSVNPTNDGQAVRINFPPMTQERRGELTKLVKKIGEEAKVALRTIRHDLLEEVKKDPAATEDDKFSAIKDFDKLVEEHNLRVDQLVKDKEAQILKV
ncbi:ribosome recycling factor [Candidatus Berkelbacteria bacterium]|nr:ribosome recycling factor [Candidatus Berkelbacteria bacterium]